MLLKVMLATSTFHLMGSSYLVVMLRVSYGSGAGKTERILEL